MEQSTTTMTHQYDSSRIGSVEQSTTTIRCSLELINREQKETKGVGQKVGLTPVVFCRSFHQPAKVPSVSA